MSWIKGLGGEPTSRPIPDASLEPPEPPVLFVCCDCGEEIRSGDEYYDVYDDIYCASCMEDKRRYAGVDYE